MKWSTLLIFTLFSGIQCSRILVVEPFPARSHYILSNALAKGLAEAGHDVTVVSPFEEKNPPKNGTFRNIILTGLNQESANRGDDITSWANVSPFLFIPFLNSVANEITRKAFEHPNLQKLIHSNEEFDAVVVEVFNNDAFNGLAHHFKAPLIVFSTIGPNLWVNTLVGNPSPPSYIPSAFMKYSSDMTFFERLNNWLFIMTLTLLREIAYFPEQNRIMKENLPGIPDLREINTKVSLALLNNHESINQAVPHVPNMIDIGGFHINPPKELPKDLKDFIENAKEGVVYFSMGSNIQPSFLPPETKDALLKSLGKLKQKVLWKWNEDTLPGKPDNVMLSKWFPQPDILAHPNTKLFITHGGLLSTTETIYHGVPTLVIPVFGDQKMNAVRAELNGFGIHVPFDEVSGKKLDDALSKLLNDPKYRNNAKWRSKVFHDRPVKPMDLARYWIEFVIRHKGADHLKVAGVDLPWYIYLSLDVILFVTFVSISSIATLYVVIKVLCSRRGKAQTKLKKN